MPNSLPHTTQLHRWIDRIQAGDNRAFDELVDRVCDRLVHLTRKMLRSFPNVGRWVEDDDVLQNALMRLMRTLKQMRPESMRAFYNLAAHHIRRELLDLARKFYGPEGMGAHHHSRGGDHDSKMSSSWEPPDVAESPEDLDRWCCFHEAVEKLPVEQREVISLIFYHGWTQAEVAEIFKVTERTIRRRWQEALLALRASLNGHHSDFL